MISKNIQKTIESVLQPKMENYFATSDAQKLLKGKESGHIMGTIVEEMCGNFLNELGYHITKEVNQLGEAKARAHSDFNIVLSVGSGEETVHRVNVKFSGEKSGQPNVCAANRMMNALRDGVIDGYYMLKVKFDRVEKETKVYFVDILDYIDCLTFNAGPGQIMLHERSFYEAYDNKEGRVELSVDEKRKAIYNLYIEKTKEHLELRKLQLEKRIGELESFSI